MTFLIHTCNANISNSFRSIPKNIFTSFSQYTGSTPVLTVADPELIRDILVKDFDCFSLRRPVKSGQTLSNIIFRVNEKDWKRMRQILSPMFSSENLKK